MADPAPVFNLDNAVPLGTPVAAPVFNIDNAVPVGLPNETVLHADTNTVYEMPHGTLSRIGAIYDRAFDKGDDQTQASKLNWEWFLGNDTPTIRAELDKINKRLGRDIKTNNFVEEGVRASAQQLPFLRDVFGKAAERGMQGGMAGGVAGLSIAGIGAVPGFFAGISLGGLTGAVEQSFIFETADAFSEIREFKDSKGKPIDIMAARIGAVASGALSAGMELLPMGLLFRLVPGSKNVIAKLGDKALKTLRIPVGKTALRKFVINISTIIATETVVESVGQELIAKIAIGEVTKLVSDGDYKPISAEAALDRVSNAAVEALKATPLIATGFSSPRLVADVIKDKLDKNKRPDTKVERVKDMKNEVVDGITSKLRTAPVSPDLKTYEVSNLNENETDALNEVGIKIGDNGTLVAEDAELIAAESMRRTDFYQKQLVQQQKTNDTGEAAALRKVARGRIRKIDELVKNLDQRIDDTLETIDARKALDKPTKTLDKRVNSLVKKREVLDEARADLLTAERPLAKRREALRATDEKIELKGVELLKSERRAAKGRQRALEKGVREGARLARTDVKAAQAFVVDLVKKSGLTPADKSKFLTAIKNIQNGEQLQRMLPKLQNRISKLVTASRRRVVTNKLGKVLKKTTVKGNKGKFGPDVQAVLDVARKAFDVSKETAIERLETRAGNGTTELPTPTEVLENKLLAAVANPSSVSVEQLEQLLETITSLVDLGRSIRGGTILAKQQANTALTEEFLELIGPERSETDKQRQRRLTLAKVEVNTFMGMSAAWWNKIKRVMQSSDKARVDEMTIKLGMFDESRAFDRGKEGAVKRFTELVLNALNTTSERAAWKKLTADETEQMNMGAFLHSDGVYRNLDVTTRSQVRKRVMELKDPALRESMMSEKGNAYTDEIIQALDAQMTEQDLRLIDAQLEFYEEYYVRINEVYERVYGYSLPKIEFYSPIKREYADDTVDEFMKGIIYRGGVAPGSLKSRKPNIRPIRASGDLNVMHSHISEMEYFMAYAEKVQQLNAVVKNPEIQTRIQRVFGSDMLQTINTDLDSFSKRGVQNSIAGEQFFQTMMRNFSFAQLGAKPQIGLKQLASFAAYCEDVKVTDFVAGMADFAKNPRAALRILSQSELFLKRGNNIDRDYQALLSDKSWFNFMGKRPTLTKIIMLPIRLGDKGAIAIGGYAHYFAKLKAGVDPAKALRDVEILTSRTQQSTDIDQLSALQRTSSLVRVMTQFMSSANALTRAEYNAILDRSSGRITRGEFAKRIVMLHMVIPGLIQFIANGLSWDTEDQLRSSMLGTVNGLFIFNDLADAAYRVFTNDEAGVFDMNVRHPLSFVGDMGRAITDYVQNDVTWEDFIEGSKSVDAMIDGIGKLTGIPLDTMVNEMRGLGEIVKGGEDNLRSGSAKMLGYSPYIVDNKILAP